MTDSSQHVLNENHRIFNVKTKENDFNIAYYHFGGLYLAEVSSKNKVDIHTEDAN